MKLFIVFGLLGLALSGSSLRSTPELESLDFAQVMEMIGGFLTGMGSDLPPNDIKSCVSDDGRMASDFDKAYTDFKENTFDSVKNGLAALSDAFGTLPTAVTQCTTAYAQTVADIKSACSKFKNPISLVFHIGKTIIVDGAEIFGDLSDAMQQWEDKNYYKCGFDVGQAMFKVLDTTNQDEDLELGSKEVYEIVKGLLEGMAIDLKISQIEGCISHTKQIGNDLETAIKDFDEHSFSGVWNAIKEIGATFKELPAQIVECKASAKDAAAKLEKALKVFQNPVSLVWVFGKTLVLNGVQILTEIVTAVIDWGTHDYVGFGRNVGEALFQFVKHD